MNAPSYTTEQLDNMVAPIALYPDGLLSQVLVASTYPEEVAQAQQWVAQHPNLQGVQLVDAAKQQPWDPSVQALVAFPGVLTRLNQDMQWTTSLGNAFLTQEGDVMAAVQRMRQEAQASGKLTSNQQQMVTTQMQNGQPVIVIQPANPNVVYVPDYNPAYVWGAPAYGYYPSLYYPAYGWAWGPGINLAFLFGGWGGWGGWGWGPNWYGRSVVVNNGFFTRYGYRGYGRAGRTPWAHNPEHRRGVPYGRGFRPSERGYMGGGARPGGPPVSTPRGREGFMGGTRPGTPSRVAPGARPGVAPTQPGRSGFMPPRGGASRVAPAPAARPAPAPRVVAPRGGQGRGGFMGRPGGRGGRGGGGRGGRR